MEVVRDFLGSIGRWVIKYGDSRNLRWCMFWVATKIAMVIDFLGGSECDMATSGGRMLCACLSAVLRIVRIADGAAWFVAMTAMGVVGVIAHALKIDMDVVQKMMKETGTIFYMFGTVFVINTTAVMICAMTRFLQHYYPTFILLVNAVC